MVSGRYSEALASTRILKHSPESSRGQCGENLAWASYDQTGGLLSWLPCPLLEPGLGQPALRPLLAPVPFVIWPCSSHRPRERKEPQSSAFCQGLTTARYKTSDGSGPGLCWVPGTLR